MDMAARTMSQQELMGGYILLALTLIATLALAGLLLARLLNLAAVSTRLLVVLAVGAVSFQVVHFSDHLLQLGYWFAHPTEPGWMPPWSRVAAEGLACLAGYHGEMKAGMELLHLGGNWIFLTGIFALYLTVRSFRSRQKTEQHRATRRAMSATRVAFWVQLVHVIEHVSLTGSYLLMGRAIGLSTLFGASIYLGDAWASSIRIWWHFLMNLAVTVAAVLALRGLRRAGLLRSMAVPASTDEAHETAKRKRPHLMWQ